MGDDQGEAKSARGVNWHKNSDAEDGRIIMAVIGGLSHYEITQLQNLERQLGTSRLVMGSS